MLREKAPIKTTKKMKEVKLHVVSAVIKTALEAVDATQRLVAAEIAAVPSNSALWEIL